jgi:hypothetical protein
MKKVGIHPAFFAVYVGQHKLIAKPFALSLSKGSSWFGKITVNRIILLCFSYMRTLEHPLPRSTLCVERLTSMLQRCV